MVCHQPDKFGDHRHCDSGDLLISMCHLTSDGLWGFMGVCPSRQVIISSCFVINGLVPVEIKD